MGREDGSGCKVLGLPSLQKGVCEIFGEIWFGVRFEILNLHGENPGEIWGEDFSTCQESPGDFGENFGANFGANFGENFGNFVHILRLCSETSFSRRAVLTKSEIRRKLKPDTKRLKYVDLLARRNIYHQAWPRQNEHCNLSKQTDLGTVMIRDLLSWGASSADNAMMPFTNP